MKKNNPKEVIDLTTLPEVNTAITSLLFNFQNNDRRLKIIECLFKTPDKIVKLLSREHIMDYAKDNKIYVDPTEGKKPNPKDPPIEKKEITPEELAKAAAGLITESSVQFRKDKKTFLENIDALKKQKEEAIAYWDNPPPQDPKKKPDKKAPPQPNEIIIPVIDEMDTEYLVVLYNYPLTSKEYAALEKEGITINNVHLLNEVDDVLEEKSEIADQSTTKGKKPAPAKGAADANKPVTDNQILKYFAIPNIQNYSAKGVYDTLFNAKLSGSTTSLMRHTLFDEGEFAFRNMDDPKKTYYNVYQDEFVERMKLINRFYMLYKQWVDAKQFQDLGSDEGLFTVENIQLILGQSEYMPQDHEHMSVGNILINFFNLYANNLYEELQRRKDEEEAKKKQEEEQRRLEEEKRLEEERKAE